MTQPITKWYWAAKTTGAIPETIRRGMKFASTPPCGPVFLSLPTNVLRGQAKAAIWDQAKFDVPMRIRPDKDDIEKAARMLLEAKNPLMSVGDEVAWCRAGKELLELAELLGLPVAGRRARSASGRGRSRPSIRSMSGRCCATCAIPASPTCCSTSATNTASAPRPAPS